MGLKWRFPVPERAMRVALLLSALLLASVASLPGAAGAVVAEPARGDLAPTALGESAGKPVRLEDYRGKIVVVVFWNASCEPCRDQLTAFEELNRKYSAQGLQVISLNIGDSSKDYGRIMRRVLSSTMVLAHDAGTSAAQAWGVDMLPNAWIVGPDGRVITHHEGYAGEELPGILAQVARIVEAQQPQQPQPASPAPAGS
jgi:peroxiredoxin